MTLGAKDDEWVLVPRKPTEAMISAAIRDWALAQSLGEQLRTATARSLQLEAENKELREGLGRIERAWKDQVSSAESKLLLEDVRGLLLMSGAADARSSTRSDSPHSDGGGER